VAGYTKMVASCARPG